jgi:hypothetical protein
MGSSSGIGRVQDGFLNLNYAGLNLNSTAIADLGRQRPSGGRRPVVSLIAQSAAEVK